MTSFELGNFTCRSPQHWEVKGTPGRERLDLAMMLAASALGRPNERPLNWELMRFEVEVVAKLLDLDPLGQLRRRPVFEHVAGRFRRLSVEATGLAVTTHIALTMHAWEPLLGWPSDVDGLLKGRGVRPDLLFATPRGIVAGEARGRSQGRQATSVTSGQNEKLEGLARWARRKRTNVFMTWAWAGNDDTRVDHFDFERSPRPLRPRAMSRRLRRQAQQLYISAIDARLDRSSLSEQFADELRGEWFRPRSELEVFLGVLNPDLALTNVEAFWEAEAKRPSGVVEDLWEVDSSAARLQALRQRIVRFLTEMDKTDRSSAVSAAITGPVVVATRPMPIAGTTGRSRG